MPKTNNTRSGETTKTAPPRRTQRPQSTPQPTPSQPTPAQREPKYQQLAELLRDQIESGHLAPGAPLPSEAELIAAHGVSHPTARSAFRVLRELGLVVTYHGRGSFVRPLAVLRPAYNLPRAVETTHHAGSRRARKAPEAQRAHGQYRDPVIDAAVDVEEPGRYCTNAPAALALALGIAEHTPVFVYDRLLVRDNGQRLTYRLHVPLSLAAEVPALEDNPFRGPGDLYNVLATHADATGTGPLNWTEHVRARTPTPDDANTLRSPNGVPILTTHRQTRDNHGRILTLEDIHTTAANTELTFHVHPAREG